MLLVAVLAMVVNGASAWMLHDVLGHRGHEHEGDHAHEAHGVTRTEAHDHLGHEAHPRRSDDGHALNLRGAWLHLAGDTLGALAAVVAALVIRFGGSPAADPIASFVVAAILFAGSASLASGRHAGPPRGGALGTSRCP